MKKMQKALAAIACAAMLAVSMPAEARYGGSRSSFSSTRVTSSYRAPSRVYSVPSRPVYTAPRVPSYSAPRTVYRSNTTTIVNQRSGPGFFSNMLSTGAGVLGGMALFNWLSGGNNQQQAPAPAPAAASAASGVK